MSHGDVPRIYESSRDLYEKAYLAENTARLYTMQLDRKIQTTQDRLLSKVTPKPLQDLVEFRDDLLELANNGIQSPNFTDLHRFLTNLSFAVERVCVPLLFGSNSKEAQRARRSIADGMEAKSVEMMAEILREPEMMSGIFSDHSNTVVSEIFWHFRGALQEDTVAALFNSPQDGRLIAVPSSLVEDVYERTDLNVYYVAEGEGNNSYRLRVSVKSRAVDAEREKEEAPHLVVVSPVDFNNHMFRITKLLIRRNAGYPGLTEAEEQEVQDAAAKLHASVAAQIREGSGEPMQARNTKSIARIALRQLTA